MSLYNLARQVQSRGRGDDSMLVHMTPGEVKGLQALAMKHGGSLTINPETGLPEAGFLDKILPTIVGGLGAYFGVSPLTTGLISGAATYATTGNLSKGLMSGLGAWGGASLVDTMMGAGAATPNAVAGLLGADASSAPGSQAEMLSKMSGDMLDPKNIQSSASYAAGFDPKKSATPSSWDQLKSGFESTKFNTDWLKQNAFPLAATAAPLLMSDTSQPSGPQPVSGGQIKPYTYSQTRNPEFGMVPGAPYFNQSYTAGTPYAAKQGGLVALASGGMPSGPVERMSMNDMKPGMYPQGMIASAKYATPSQVPASMEMVKSDYDVGVNPMTGLQDRNMANGGIVALADGGIPPVTQLQLAPNLGRYSQPAPAINPSVAAYNQILADRAANEYVKQLPPLTMLPGGGERATPEDTSKIISQYYQSVLGRQPDQPGLEYWTQQKQQGMSLADVRNAIKGSTEGQIFGLYRDILGRRPDEEGAKYWESQLAAGVPFADIRKQFEASPEFQAMPKPQTTEAKPTLGGYTYDPITGQYTKAPEAVTDTTGGLLGGMDFNQPGFQDFLQRQYQQYQQSLQGGAGGKAGGLMPTDLKSGGVSDLGDYSDGGRLLKGPGDGVSDSIPAQIGERQPARLADGEFVVPARIVSELGNGSTDAGARKLYAMMDRIQKKRKKSIGKDNVAVNSGAEKVLPA